MSGIYGYIYKEQGTDCGRLAAMEAWHRGYGGKGKCEKYFSSAAIGCCLNQIRENVTAEALICENERYFGVFDALIYNREELIPWVLKLYPGKSREELESASDERLLFLIFRSEGEEGLRKVNGDFSGAVYDMTENKMTIFRDHLGVRPLFIYEDDKVFAFATDYRGLLAMPEADLSIHEGYLYAQLNGQNIRNDELTDFLHIKALPPASILSYYGRVGVKDKRVYWRLGERKIRYSADEDYIAEMRRLVKDAVERRMNVSSAPIGGELSGGLDSTVIAVMIHNSGRENCFISWSPDRDRVPFQERDERIVIEKTCERYGIKCSYCDMDNSYEKTAIIEGLESMRPPGTKDDVIGVCMKYFSENDARVAFSGWGGDEGVSHRANPLELWLHKEYGAYLKLWWERTKGKKLRILRFVKSLFCNLVIERKKRLSSWNASRANGWEKLSIINPSFRPMNSEKLENIPIFFPFDPIRHIEFGGNRARTECAAVLGAENHIQYLFPYLDFRVEDYAVSIPRRMYLRGTRNRYIYREAFKEEMVDELYTYQYKDDPGKGKYIEEHDGKCFETVCGYIMEHLDWEFWSRYLNRAELQDMLSRAAGKESSEVFSKIYVVEVLKRCYGIQILQKGMAGRTQELMKLE